MTTLKKDEKRASKKSKNVSQKISSCKKQVPPKNRESKVQAGTAVLDEFRLRSFTPRYYALLSTYREILLETF